VTTIHERGVRFYVYPQDHDPPHAHGVYGQSEIIILLFAAGRVGLGDPKRMSKRAKHNEVRHILNAAAACYDRLAAAWEAMHG
jgi:hypothetical protein